jgi:hypothetical protein
LDFHRNHIQRSYWMRGLDLTRGAQTMSQLPEWALWTVVGTFAALVLCGAVLSGYTMGVKDTIKEAQRSAVVAGAARWSSNRETGEAQFDYVTCLKPEIK